MVKYYDRAELPFPLEEHLRSLLNSNLISVSRYFDNGTPAAYQITEEGRTYLHQNVHAEDIISYIKTLQFPDQLLLLVSTCLDKKSSL